MFISHLKNIPSKVSSHMKTEMLKKVDVIEKKLEEFSSLPCRWELFKKCLLTQKLEQDKIMVIMQEVFPFDKKELDFILKYRSYFLGIYHINSTSKILDTSKNSLEEILSFIKDNGVEVNQLNQQFGKVASLEPSI